MTLNELRTLQHNLETLPAGIPETCGQCEHFNGGDCFICCHPPCKADAGPPEWCPRRKEDVSMKMEDKLKELMSAKEYEAWSKMLAKETFMQEVEMSPDEDFKAFVKENFDVISGEVIDGKEE